MKKKIFNVLMAAVFFTAATSMFISCKDYEGDVDNEFRSSINYLNDALAYQASQLQAQLDSLKKLQQECRDSCKVKQQNLQTQIDSLKKLQQECRDSCQKKQDELQQQINNLKNITIKNLEQEIAKLKTNDSIFNKDIEGINKTLGEYKTSIETNTTNITNLTKQYNTLDSTLSKTFADYKAGWDWLNQNKTNIEYVVNNYSSIIETKITGLRDTANKALALANQAYIFAQKDSAAIDSIFTKILPNYYTKTEINTMRDSLNEKIEAAKAVADRADTVAAKAYHLADSAIVLANAALDSARENRIAIGELEQAMKAADQALKEEIDSVARQLDTLKIKVNNIEKELGIVKSNLAKMITNIIPQCISNPVTGTLITPFDINTNILCAFYGYSLKNVDFPVDALGADVMSFIGSSESFIINNGETLVDDMDYGKAYAGKVYVTINPNTVNFAGETLELETSAGNVSSIKLTPLVKSDKELMFGYTRANNGFYEADAFLDYDKVEDAKITKYVDVESLKAIAKQALNKIKDRKNNEFNITNAAQTIFKAVSNVIPAYALKATWTDADTVTHSIYSEYKLAATALSPLSYEFLGNWKAPKIPSITYDKLGIKLKLEEPEGVYFNSTTPIYFVYDASHKLVSVHGGWIYGNTLADNEKAKQDAINEAASIGGTWELKLLKDLMSTYDALLLDKVITDAYVFNIHELEKNIKQQIEDNIKKILDRVNNVIDKINSKIQNANYYLQPNVLVYDGKVWNRASQRQLMPSIATGAGWIILQPSSNSAELLAPAYKKFVAVTNVIKDDFSANAKEGDATCKSILNAANNPAQGMATIYSGKDPIAFNATQTGYIYEVSYASVDYKGATRVDKVYIRVK